LFLGETIFERGDYELALERLKEAKLTYALETKGEFNLFYAIKNNPVEYASVFFASISVIFGGALLTRRQLLRRKLRMLGEEEVLLLELMKLMQRECFEGNKMSMEEYEQAMYQYETKLSETIGEKIRVQTKLENLMKIRGKRKALDLEKKRLLELIKEVQNEYLNKGKIETRIYENMMRSYTARLSEVEEKIASYDAQDALKMARR
jgi:hypothetical protein